MIYCMAINEGHHLVNNLVTLKLKKTEPSVKKHLRNMPPLSDRSFLINKKGGKSVYTLDSRLKIQYVCHFPSLIFYVITSIYDLLYLYTLTVFIKITSNIFAYDMATFLPNFALILNPIIP